MKRQVDESGFLAYNGMNSLKRTDDIYIYKMLNEDYMIKSMTGFGRFEDVGENHRLTVEIKSVNHRYLDLSIKMPKKFNCFESAIRNLLREDLQRGKVDIFITFEDFSEDRVSLKYNHLLAREYVGYFSKMHEDFDIPNDITVSKIASLPEVFQMEQVDTDASVYWPILSRAVSGAVKELSAARELEGESLKADLLQKLESLSILTQKAVEYSPRIIEEYRNRLYEKMKEILETSDIDESRILQEAAIFADKVCVDEELVRLNTHIRHMAEVLKDGNGVGRKLDFLAQEMNREANTTLSKSNDAALSDLAINMKTEIEKIREQVQNIE